MPHWKAIFSIAIFLLDRHLTVRPLLCFPAADTARKVLGKMLYPFVRVGSAYIVNLRNIKNVSNSEVYLYNNIIIPIPRGKHTEIKKAFWDYQYEGQED